jgi:hypothetical protein
LEVLYIFDYSITPAKFYTMFQLLVVVALAAAALAAEEELSPGRKCPELLVTASLLPNVPLKFKIVLYVNLVLR